jgi:anti-sigma factor RsiW
MTCRHCQRLLSPYLDDALRASEKEQVMSHVACCSYCGELLRQLSANRQLLQGLPEAEITAALTMKLKERLERLGASEVTRPRTFSWYTSLKSQVSSLKLSWRNWGMVSVGTLATAAAVLFYVSTLQRPAEVSAEEVVSSMTQLLEELDPNDGTTILNEETLEERRPNWHEDFDSWFSDDDDEHE